MSNMFKNNAQMHCILDSLHRSYMRGIAREQHFCSILNYFIFHCQVKPGRTSPNPRHLAVGWLARASHPMISKTFWLFLFYCEGMLSLVVL